MSTAIQKFEQPQSLAPNVQEFSVMKETASMLVKTGFLPQSIKTAEQAVAIILTGRELGIGTMAALNNINVIQGKPTVSPQLMLALIERSGQLEDIKVTQGENGVMVDMKRRSRSTHREIFGKREADALGLSSKDNYKKQPFVMYRWRAIAACARVVFPDVITGLYTPDELGADVNEEGEILTPARPNIVDLPPNPTAGPNPFIQRAEVEAIDAEVVEESAQTTQDQAEALARAIDRVTHLLKKVGINPQKSIDKLIADPGKADAAVVEVSKLVVKKTFDAQKWNEREQLTFLNDYGLESLDDATIEDLDAIITEFENGKML